MKNVPELRFKEFSGEWKYCYLNEIIEIFKKKFNPKKNSANQICIELEHISSETGKLLGYINSNNQSSIKNIFKENQIIYGKLRPYLRKFWFTKFNGVCSSEFWVFNGKQTDNKYLYFFIQTEKFNQISNISCGSKMPRADWNYMSLFKFFIPSLPEQQKIASFLSTIDKKIELTDKRLEYLESYKKGLMQKLLTGEIRFPGFNDEWKEEKLGDLLTEIKKEKIENQQLYKVANIQLYGKGMKHTNKTPNITEKGRPYFIINEGDILIGKQAFHCGSIAIATKDFQNCVTSNAILHTIENSQKLIKDFIVLYLKNESFYNSLKNISEGTGQKEIAKNEFNNIKINIPSLPEQQKIASFLSAIDKKIELTKSRLENLKTYKKSLLQKMFV